MFLRLQECTSCYSLRLKVFTYLFDTMRIHVLNMSIKIHYPNLEAYESSHYNRQDSTLLLPGNYRITYGLGITGSLSHIEHNQESHRRIFPHNLPLESKFYQQSLENYKQSQKTLSKGTVLCFLTSTAKQRGYSEAGRS